MTTINLNEIIPWYDIPSESDDQSEIVLKIQGISGAIRKYIKANPMVSIRDVFDSVLSFLDSKIKGISKQINISIIGYTADKEKTTDISKCTKLINFKMEYK